MRWGLPILLVMACSAPQAGRPSEPLPDVPVQRSLAAGSVLVLRPIEVVAAGDTGFVYRLAQTRLYAGDLAAHHELADPSVNTRAAVMSLSYAADIPDLVMVCEDAARRLPWGFSRSRRNRHLAQYSGTRPGFVPVPSMVLLLAR